MGGSREGERERVNYLEREFVMYIISVERLSMWWSKLLELRLWIYSDEV